MFARGYSTDYSFFSPSTYGISHWMVWSKQKKIVASSYGESPSNKCWLVVTGTMEFWMTFPSYWECHHPNWRTHSIIFRGVGLNQQPDGYETYKNHIWIYNIYMITVYIYIYDYSIYIYDYIWYMDVSESGVCREPGFFLRGYHIFREIQTLSRTDIGEFFLVHQQGFLKCQTLESSSLICGQPLQCLVVSNKPFAIVYIYIFFFLAYFHMFLSSSFIQFWRSRRYYK